MRINRKRRAFGTTRFYEGCTQYQLLRWGSLLSPEDGPGFEDESEMRRVWNAHKSELLAECGPGERPYAFYFFDLGIRDRVVHGWAGQVGVLMDRGLIDATEAAGVEANYRMLNAGAAEYMRALDRPDGILTMLGGPRTKQSEIIMAGIVTECEVAARWHAWRGRPELAALYDQRAKVAVAAILAEGVK